MMQLRSKPHSIIVRVRSCNLQESLAYVPDFCCCHVPMYYNNITCNEWMQHYYDIIHAIIMVHGYLWRVTG